MAKELPYFKFDAAEWINGSITLEDFETQGLFINICAHYWFKSGKLSLTEIKRRLSGGKASAFDSLLASGIVGLDDDMIIISFLDEQLEERQALSQQNSANGRKGGRKKATALMSLSETKANQSNIEEKRREERRIDREVYPSPKIAFEDITNNYKETESHVNIIANKGWRAATQKDSNALLFHFLESQVDFSTQSPSDVKNHFRRWLNKQPIENLQQLTQKIHERTR
jgi:hypothetical protein